MEEQQFLDLLYGYVTETIGPEDRRILLAALQEPQYQAVLERFVDEKFRDGDYLIDESLSLKEDSAREIGEMLSGSPKLAYMYVPKKKRLFSNAFLEYAAAILFLMLSATTVYWLFSKSGGERAEIPVASAAPKQSTNEIPPGSEKAILTLSDGTNVVLGEGNEVLEDSGVRINKFDGKLVYSKTSIVAWNTMSTPRGGQYKLVLPDGTNVWLNAASSITFPTAFDGKERKVRITGEVFLEVARNPGQPFTVEAGTESITVLGTQFNINAYHDESQIRTTLVEGLIQVNNTVVRPGQVYYNNKVEQADVDQAIAWKNGFFNFHKMRLSAAMRQLARWYDVEVVYEGKIPELVIFGEMGRDLNLSQVLEILADMNVRCRMEGRKLIIMP